MPEGPHAVFRRSDRVPDGATQLRTDLFSGGSHEVPGGADHLPAHGDGLSDSGSQLWADLLSDDCHAVSGGRDPLPEHGDRVRE